MGDVHPGPARSSALSPPGVAHWLELAARDAGGALGRLAVLRARLGSRVVEPQPQHVHADRARRRASRTRYSVVATLVPGLFPASFRDAHGGRSPVYFEAAAVIVDAGPARPGARAARAQPDRAPRSGRCSGSRRRPRGGSSPTAARRTCRSSTCTSATGCACGPARRCRSTASCSRARARSTSRWSPASRSRSRSRRATA